MKEIKKIETEKIKQREENRRIQKEVRDKVKKDSLKIILIRNRIRKFNKKSKNL